MAVQKANVLSIDGRKPLCPELDEQLMQSFASKKSPVYMKAYERDAHLKKRVMDKCAKDPLFFILGGFVRTYDSHDQENPYKPLPAMDLMREVLKFIHSDDEVNAIAKSRQMMISWLICAYAVWDARFHRARNVMIQSKKAEDAWALVFYNDWLTSRCAFIEAALPPWFWLDNDGKYVTGTRGKLLYPHGSVIQAIPGGAHHFRSHTASLAFIDEACFMPDFGETYKAALAMVKGGGKLRIVSSAKYGSYFGNLIQAEQHLESAA